MDDTDAEELECFITEQKKQTLPPPIKRKTTKAQCVPDEGRRVTSVVPNNTEDSSGSGARQSDRTRCKVSYETY